MILFRFLKSNLSHLAFILFALILFFSMDARVLMIKGLMGIGLYHVEAPAKPQGYSGSVPTDLAFRSHDGKLITISEHKGEVYFINFWATWCPPCRAEMPSINSLSTKIQNKEKVHFIMVDVDNKISNSVKYMKRNSFGLTVYSIESPIPEYIFSGTLPTTIIVGPKGDIVFQHSGLADYDNFEMLNFINTLSR